MHSLTPRSRASSGSNDPRVSAAYTVTTIFPSCKLFSKFAVSVRHLIELNVGSMTSLSVATCKTLDDVFHHYLAVH
jgi:hypothetical protein